MAREDKAAIHTAYDEYVPFDPANPEKNLLRAVLLTALSDLKKPGEPARRATEFFLNDDESYLYSFVSICNHLDIDGGRILQVAGIRIEDLRGLISPAE